MTIYTILSVKDKNIKKYEKIKNYIKNWQALKKL